MFKYIILFGFRLRDEVRNLPCTYKCRHDAAADLIHTYAYTKSFFRIRVSPFIVLDIDKSSRRVSLPHPATLASRRSTRQLHLLLYISVLLTCVPSMLISWVLPVTSTARRMVRTIV